jgi:hypothetical protein
MSGVILDSLAQLTVFGIVRVVVAVVAIGAFVCGQRFRMEVGNEDESLQ